MAPVLTTPRLRLRPVARDDVAPLARILAEPSVSRWWHGSDEAFRGHPPGTHAIDQFIGEPDMVDRGHGSAFVRAFIEHVLADGAPRVITDPDPANARAIRAYEKAGFARDRLVDTPDGIALLMARDA